MGYGVARMLDALKNTARRSRRTTRGCRSSPDRRRQRPPRSTTVLRTYHGVWTKALPAHVDFPDQPLNRRMYFLELLASRIKNTDLGEIEVSKERFQMPE